MAKLRVLVKRRRAIRNIRKITRTMELIATARFKRAMDRALEAEVYTRKVAELAADLTRSAGEVSHPLLEVRTPPRKALLLVIGSNRGFCGGYNTSILREAGHRIRELEAGGTAVELELSGKRAVAFFRYQGRTPLATYTHFENKPRFQEVEVLADRYVKMYTDREIDRLDVAYMKFLSAGRQAAVAETMLPLSAVGSEGPAPAGPGVDYEFVPAAGEILEELVPMAFKIRLFKCFLDAAVSEQIARRVAMKAATENAGELINRISRTYNRERQAQITKEISEVIGGAEALK